LIYLNDLNTQGRTLSIRSTSVRQNDGRRPRTVTLRYDPTQIARLVKRGGAREVDILWRGKDEMIENVAINS